MSTKKIEQIIRAVIPVVTDDDRRLRGCMQGAVAKILPAGNAMDDAGSLSAVRNHNTAVSNGSGGFNVNSVTVFANSNDAMPGGTIIVAAIETTQKKGTGERDEVGESYAIIGNRASPAKPLIPYYKQVGHHAPNPDGVARVHDLAERTFHLIDGCYREALKL